MSSRMEQIKREIEAIKDRYISNDEVIIKISGKTVTIITSSVSLARVLAKKTGYDIRVA